MMEVCRLFYVVSWQTIFILRPSILIHKGDFQVDVLANQASNLLSVSQTGTLIVLKCPYPWHVEEPSIYESVRVHTAIQTGRTENDLVANAPSV